MTRLLPALSYRQDPQLRDLWHDSARARLEEDDYHSDISWAYDANDDDGYVPPPAAFAVPLLPAPAIADAAL
jgi:hypothetical protein